MSAEEFVTRLTELAGEARAKSRNVVTVDLGDLEKLLLQHAGYGKIVRARKQMLSENRKLSLRLANEIRNSNDRCGDMGEVLKDAETVLDWLSAP